MRVMVLIHVKNGSKSLTVGGRGLYLMLPLHPAHSDVVLVGVPCTFLQEKGRRQNAFMYLCVRVIVVFWQNESHLAVKHLVASHVVQLDSVQVISAKRHHIDVL